jgi:hypothetical protein
MFGARLRYALVNRGIDQLLDIWRLVEAAPNQALPLERMIARIVEDVSPPAPIPRSRPADRPSAPAAASHQNDQ